MTVQRFVALAYPKQLSAAPDFSIPQLRATEANKASVAKKFGLNKQPLLALCPGAEYGPAKRWPAGYFATVAKAKHQQGWQVCLMGSEKDEEICTELNALSGGICLNLAGKTQLFEAIDVLAQAEVVVSNDSGLMHIAAALDRRLIAIYGSSDPGFTPPLHAKATILQLRFSCSPCFKRECPLVHMDCLNKLTPAQVLAAIDA
jgi:heptosyltransferase-2